MQTVEQTLHGARLGDDVAQVAAGAYRAVADFERGILQTDIDEVILQRRLIHEVALGLALLHLVE